MSYQSTHDHHADGNHGWDTVVAEVNHMHQLLEVGALHVATVGSNSRKRQQLAEGPGPKTASTNALPT